MHYERFQPIVNDKQKQVFLVDMKEDLQASLFSSLAKKTLENYIPQGKKVLIIWGKKGLASWVQCQDCGYIPKCQHCDIPVAYHRDQWGQTFGICHICKASYSAIGMCPTCGGYDIDLFGTGLQKIEEQIHELYPTCKTLCLAAEQVSSLPKITKIHTDIQEAQCLITTGIWQVAPYGWQPDAVIIIRADSSLSIPDWKVSEHCYTMLSTCIAQYDCPIIIQAYSVWHHALRAACAADEKLFWQEENTYREQYAYPPYAQMAIVFYRHEIEETMFTRVHKLYQELLYLQKTDNFVGEIFATPPLIYKMYDKYKYNIVLKWKDLRPFLEKAFAQLAIRDRWFKVDWLPEHVV